MHIHSCMLFAFGIAGLLIIYLNEVSNGQWVTKKIGVRTYLFCLLQLFCLKDTSPPAVKRNQEFWQWLGAALSRKTEQLLIRGRSFDVLSWRQSMGVASNLLLGAGHLQPHRALPLPWSPPALPLPF